MLWIIVIPIYFVVLVVVLIRIVGYFPTCTGIFNGFELRNLMVKDND